MEHNGVVINAASINNITINNYSNGEAPHSQTGRPKWSRTVFTDSQRSYLEERFNENNYVSSVQCHEIATLLGLPYPLVRRWFRNRREGKKKGARDLPGRQVGRWVSE
nr:hypothetical transcript [Hymenolepis microstoma]